MTSQFEVPNVKQGKNIFNQYISISLLTKQNIVHGNRSMLERMNAENS